MMWLVRFVLRLLALIPLRLMHALGAGLGWVIYALSARVRARLKENLALAGLDDPATRRAAIESIGQGALELPAIWMRSDTAIGRLILGVDGEDLVHAARAQGKGVIFMTPHLGCFELAGQWLGRNMPVTVLYRRPKLAWLEPLLTLGRERGQVKLARADMAGVRRLFKSLRQGEAVGILPDQVPGAGEGEWAEFFGRPAYTMTLAMRLHESSGAPIVLGYARRLPRGGGYRLEGFLLPDRLPGESAASQLNRGIELMVRRCPGQYLWSYNRYKVPGGVAPPTATVRA